MPVKSGVARLDHGSLTNIEGSPHEVTSVEYAKWLVMAVCVTSRRKIAYTETVSARGHNTVNGDCSSPSALMKARSLGKLV